MDRLVEGKVYQNSKLVGQSLFGNFRASRSTFHNILVQSMVKEILGEHYENLPTDRDFVLKMSVEIRPSPFAKKDEDKEMVVPHG